MSAWRCFECPEHTGGLTPTEADKAAESHTRATKHATTTSANGDDE